MTDLKVRFPRDECNDSAGHNIIKTDTATQQARKLNMLLILTVHVSKQQQLFTVIVQQKYNESKF